MIEAAIAEQDRMVAKSLGILEGVMKLLEVQTNVLRSALPAHSAVPFVVAKNDHGVCLWKEELCMLGGAGCTLSCPYELPSAAQAP
ncbi:hypothetical protein CVT25_001411 [Psilocybe cyanescens]|uniref:Uncharacterized protein n=1 Tax=Psilocybe cyanescens TaxID=93625 RepID=A0A409WND0_PSICY|nr:hypothetical protein CVT25_001411 [Psilocybe cyanescens]